MSDQQWRVLDGNGNDQGPYSLQDLQGYYTTGNITHDTLVWTEGLADWTPAGQIQGLLPDAPLPVVPLAEATPAPVDPPEPSAPVGGINLSPQVAVSKGSKAAEKATGGGKKGAPTWLSIATIAIGVITLILFFFPWVSAEQDVSFTINEKVETIFTQTGMQSLSGEITPTDSFISWMSTATGIPEAVLREKGGTRGEKSDEKSILNLIAIIVIALSVILALIGLLNKMSSLTTIAQLCLTVAGLLIGIQMARQFPVIDSYSKAMKETNAQAQKDAKAERENPSDPPPPPKPAEVPEPPGEGEATAAADGNEAEGAKPKPKPAAPAERETITLAKKVGIYYKTSFEASCLVTVSLLAATIFLLVITMSSSNSTPLIIPQGGFQMPQTGGQQAEQPQQPHQPGSGLKFH